MCPICLHLEKFCLKIQVIYNSNTLNIIGNRLPQIHKNEWIIIPCCWKHAISSNMFVPGPCTNYNSNSVCSHWIMRYSIFCSTDLRLAKEFGESKLLLVPLSNLYNENRTSKSKAGIGLHSKSCVFLKRVDYRSQFKRIDQISQQIA